MLAEDTKTSKALHKFHEESLVIRSIIISYSVSGGAAIKQYAETKTATFGCLPFFNLLRS